MQLGKLLGVDLQHHLALLVGGGLVEQPAEQRARLGSKIVCRHIGTPSPWLLFKPFADWTGGCARLLRAVWQVASGEWHTSRYPSLVTCVVPAPASGFYICSCRSRPRGNPPALHAARGGHSSGRPEAR